MKMRYVMCALFTLSFGATVFGALSKEYVEFGKGPTALLLTKSEQKQWQAIATDDQAKQFIDLFWARRDSTPGTAANEFRVAIEDRIKVADSLYTTGKTRGAASDRGKVFVLMGAATTLQRSGPQTGVRSPNSTFGTQTPDFGSTAVQGRAPSERWLYEQRRTDLALGQQRVEIAFSDQYATNDWKMERSAGTDYAAVFERISSSYITQPDLKEVPTYAIAAATPLAITTPSVSTTTAAAASTLKSEALRSAIDAARAAKAQPDALFLSYGEFVTPAGEYFVPVQLFAPKSAGLTAGTPVTFFGTVEKAEGGGSVLEIEEPATLTAAGDAVFHARSLTIPAGNYVGTFGLAKDGKPIAVVSKPMTLQGVDPVAPAVSPLMLSTNVYALSEAQRPNDPFAFGGIKVVPKGDLTFRPSDNLWYFMEARNPGMDATTGQPKVSMKIAITGTAADGTVVNRSSPAELTQVQTLKGVPGHYALVESMPLATMKPGSYTLSIKVNDLALGKSYDLKESFRVIE
jgi:GWxTD domain-containing protein